MRRETNPGRLGRQRGFILSALAALASAAAGFRESRAATDPDAAFYAEAADLRARVQDIPAVFRAVTPTPIPLGERNLPNAPTAGVCKRFQEAPKLRYTLALRQAAGGKDLAIPFQYRGCGEYGRDDYLPPYTELDFASPDGLRSMAIVTDADSAVSEVVLAFRQPGKSARIGPDTGLLPAENIQRPGTWILGRALTYIDFARGGAETPVKAALTVAR